MNKGAEITNLERAEYGLAAIEVGSPDFASNDQLTNAVDVIANVLHAASGRLEANDIAARAIRHFEREWDEERKGDKS